jgi:hypothetical protein
VAIASVLLCITVLGLEAGDMPADLPQGDGIAAKYPGDVGIEEDPAVVFADGFETVEGDRFTTGERARAGSRWNNRWDHVWDRILITEDPDNVHTGTKAVEIAHQRPTSKGAGRHFEQGFDTLHVRYYMKYHEEFPGCHHTGMCILAGAPGVTLAIGSATGVTPDGRNHFSALLDTYPPRPGSGALPPGKMTIYCYHMDQGGIWGNEFFPDGDVNPSRNRRLLGEDFVPRPNVNPERGRWYCFELMLKANTPGKRDGRIAFWVDGKLAGDFPGLRFREVEELKPNHVFLLSYSSELQPNQTHWYDDVVAATSYIGPMRPAEPEERTETEN